MVGQQRRRSFRGSISLANISQSHWNLLSTSLARLVFMARSSAPVALLLLMSLGLALEIRADPELVTDFFVPNSVNASDLDGSFFTFTGLRNGFTGSSPGGFSIAPAFSQQFPALTGLGVSLATVHIQPDEVVPLHIHPRGSEIFHVIEGELTVGFTDSTNKLFSQDLKAGDLFAIPEGMVHFYANLDKATAAKAIIALGSSEPGFILIPDSLFGSGISDVVLQKSFGASDLIISALKAPHQVIALGF